VNLSNLFGFLSRALRWTRLEAQGSVRERRVVSRGVVVVAEVRRGALLSGRCGPYSLRVIAGDGGFLLSGMGVNIFTMERKKKKDRMRHHNVLVLFAAVLVV
jgi:hypothetical protein